MVENPISRKTPAVTCSRQPWRERWRDATWSIFTASSEKPRDHSEIGWSPPFPPPPPPPRALLRGDELEGVAGPRDDEDVDEDDAWRDDDEFERDFRE